MDTPGTGDGWFCKDLFVCGACCVGLEEGGFGVRAVVAEVGKPGQWDQATVPPPLGVCSKESAVSLAGGGSEQESEESCSWNKV